MPVPGGFEISAPVGVELEPLVTSSKSNKLVSSFEAEPEALDRMMKEFRPTGKPLLLAARMSGRFKTAFPNGNPKPTPVPASSAPAPDGAASGSKPSPGPAIVPSAPAAEPATPPATEAKPKIEPTPVPAPSTEVKPAPAAAPAPSAAPGPSAAPAPAPAPAPEAKATGAKPDTGGEKDEAKPAAESKESAPKGGAFLKETEKDKTSNLVVIGDMDFLFDAFAVEVVNIGPVRQAVPRNQNLSLVQNLVDNLAGDARLITLRSRASTRRPFTLLNEMQSKADSRMADRIKELEEKEQEVGKKLQEALKVQEDGAIVLDQAAIDKGTIDKLRHAQVDARKDIRTLQKNLKAEKDSVVNIIKLLNIAVMPLLVIIVGLALYGKRQNRMAAR
jgi:ABC-type uncharacterized transport system involved in gliding motility auxiliary subunit